MAQSSRHSPHLDDALAEEVDIEIDQAGGAMAVDRRDVDPTAAESHREDRAELAARLAPVSWPAFRRDLLVAAHAEGAAPSLIASLRRLNGRRRFNTVQEVWEDLGGADDLDERQPPPSRRPAAGRSQAATTAGPTGRGPADERTGVEPEDVPDTASRGTTRFDFRFGRLVTPFAALAGATPWTTNLEVTRNDLTVRFGPWVLETPLENISGVSVTGPYRLLKVAGPPHLSLSDGGITFATNRRRGVCIRFHEAVPAILPVSAVKHGSATVTVAEPERLADLLRHRVGLPG